MRLSTCVALEFVVGISLAAGLSVSVSWGVQEVRDHWQREARAAEVSQAIMADQRPAVDSAVTAPRGSAHLATKTPATGETAAHTAPGQPLSKGLEPGLVGTDLAIAPVQSGTATEVPLTEVDAGVVAKPGQHSYYGVFHGVQDQLLLAPLRNSAIKRVKFNRGGSSVSLRIDFQNGARAAFKPQQKAPQTVPRKEIAAYRFNRILGLNAVPPAIGRRFVADDILSAVIPSSQQFLPRLKAEMRVRDGEVFGELSWWIPIIKKAEIEGYEIDTTDGIVTWKRYLTAGRDMPDDTVNLLAQISTMVLFDFLINNPDRWSGANARVSKDGTFLYFMDNTMSFLGDEDGHHKARTYLKRSQKFSRSLVARLRSLTGEEVREAVAHDKGPFDFLLTKREIAMLMKRRDYALNYIDELILKHGEDVILVFP